MWHGPRALLFLWILLLGVRSATPQPSNPPRLAIRYRSVLVQGPSTVIQLRQQFGPDGYALILKINRVDAEHVRKGDSLLVPEQMEELRLFTPFPEQLPSSTAVAGKLLMVNRRVQAFAGYSDGALVRWGPTSSGRKETPTPPGLFHTNWKAKLRRSSDDPDWLLPWYVNFENRRGVSFHQFDLPGYPASHACVRLLEDDARWIFDWVDSWVLEDGGRTVAAYGTPVIVFGEYAYETRPPWKQLADDPNAASTAEPELVAALLPEVERIAERARLRGR